MSQKKQHQARYLASIMFKHEKKNRRLRQRIAWLESKPAWWQTWKMKKWKESEPK